MLGWLPSDNLGDDSCQMC